MHFVLSPYDLPFKHLTVDLTKTETSKLFRIQLRSSLNTNTTTFLSKVSIFKFWKHVWAKFGQVMILTIAAQVQNVGIGQN